MEEVLHHLGCIKPVNNGINYLSSGSSGALYVAWEFHILKMGCGRKQEAKQTERCSFHLFSWGLILHVFWRYPVSHSFMVQQKITIPETIMFISFISWALRAMIIVGGQMSISRPNFGECSWHKHTAVRNEQLRRPFCWILVCEDFTGETKVGNQHLSTDVGLKI